MNDKSVFDRIIDGILNGLDATDKGFSSKKLAAFTVVFCIVGAHIKWIMLGNFTQLEMVLTIDYSFVCVCFGLNTIQKIKENAPKDPPKIDEPTT
jgi:hypothetical protein